MAREREGAGARVGQGRRDKIERENTRTHTKHVPRSDTA